MISFMNMMGKNPLDDGSEDEEEGGDKKKKPQVIVGWSDAVILLVIVALVFGGYQYYQYTKRKSADVFARCATLFDAAAYSEAEACYDSTWSLNYVPVAQDSLRAVRIGVVKDLRAAQEDIFDSVESCFNAKDTVGAALEMRTLKKPLLLMGESGTTWKSWEKAVAGVKLPAETAAVKDSSATPADSTAQR
ncbi:MAG: hypothetical protein WCS54_03970 [Fibrobacteraceae bacterium]